MSVVVRWLALCFDCAHRTERFKYFMNPELILKLEAEMFIVIGLESAPRKIACLIRRYMWCGIGWLNLVRETENIWRVLDWVAIQTDRQCNVNRILGDLGQRDLFCKWFELNHTFLVLTEAFAFPLLPAEMRIPHQMPPIPPFNLLPSPPILLFCIPSPAHVPHPIGNSHLLAVCFPVNIA